MSFRRLRASAIVVAAAGTLTLLFFSCFERRTLEIPVGYSQEARENPYLAAGQLLSRMGHDVVTLDGPGSLDAPPPEDATLLLPSARQTLTPTQSRALLDWAAAGGHLIVVTYSVWDDPDRIRDELLDDLGLEQYQHVAEAEESDESDATLDTGDVIEGDDPTDDDPPTDPLGKPMPEPEEPVDTGVTPAGVPAPWETALAGEKFSWDESKARLPGASESLVVQFDPDYYWEYRGEAPAWRVDGAWGAHVVSLEHGDGRITALTDELFLRNDHIGEADHAAFTLALARWNGDVGTVWMIVSDRWPGLVAQLLAHASPALLALVVLVSAWLWRASRRFGPLAPEPLPVRRRWIEHVEAVGRYHWSQDRAEGLLAGARADVLRLLERAHPAWARLSLLARAEHLAATSGLTPHEVARALEGGPAGGEATFVTDVANLERIRSTL